MLNVTESWDLWEKAYEKILNDPLDKKASVLIDQFWRDAHPEVINHIARQMGISEVHK